MLNVTKNASGQSVVSARELYAFLEVQTKFNDWISRMFEYGFSENQDYILVTQKRVTNNPKNPYTIEKDYAVTLDCAKGIAMLQRTEKGKQARAYFISLDNQVEAGKLLDAQQINNLINLCVYFGVFEYRQEAQNAHMGKFEEAWQYWQAHAKALGYTKDSLKEALACVNKKYANIQTALMQLDKPALIEKAIYDLLCALGKTSEYALNVAKIARDIAPNINIRYDALKSTLFLDSLPAKKEIKALGI
jgi:phage anti-repressor protein